MSLTRVAPRRRSASAKAGPTPGMSESSKRAMNSASAPGSTTCTPNGFSTDAAIFASVRMLAPPMESEIPVRSSTACWMRRAVPASGSWW